MHGRSISLLQPVYLPWLGYFEQMARVDRFVFFDDAQYTRQDWRNRNRIRTKNGPIWLIVPVRKCPLNTPIRDVLVDASSSWAEKHLKSIQQSYRNAPFFTEFFGDLEIVLSAPCSRLLDLDVALIRLICRYLQIETETAFSSELLPPANPHPNPTGGPADDRTYLRNMRIIEICRRNGADLFYEGARGADFIDVELFRRHGIEVVFQHYQHPVYPQCYPGFESHMSAIDLILNTGPAARDILLSSPAPESLARRKP